MEYIRSTHCECRDYPDLETLPVLERLKVKSFWNKGYINKYYEENTTAREVVECTCHKTWRYLTRYNILAEKEDLPSLEDLEKFKYQGEVQWPAKLGPAIDKSFKEKGVVFYLVGQPNCQKTTTCAKLFKFFLVKGKTCGYYRFTDLMKALSDEETSKSIYNEIKGLDLVFIEDCFENEDVVFKHKYITFYNLVLNRKGPTVLTSSLTLDDLESAKGKALPSYNLDSIKKLKLRLSKFKSACLFKDNLDLLNLQEIDLWS